MKHMSSAACVPEVLCTCADQMHAGIILNTCLACPLASILHTPLDEQSARFCAASVVTALEDLHEVRFLEAFSFFLHFISSILCASVVYYSLSFNIHISFEFQNGVLYRGVSPDVLMLDKTGHLQVGVIVCCIIHCVHMYI